MRRYQMHSLARFLLELLITLHSTYRSSYPPYSAHIRLLIQRLQLSFIHADDLFISGQTASAKLESFLDSCISLLSNTENTDLAWFTIDSENCR
jgi:hypothetical protein